MGIRVHKFLGYGLTNLVPEDERINWDSWLTTSEDMPDAEEYAAWLTERSQQRGRQSLDLIMYRALKDDGHLDLWDSISGYEHEVLALRPPFACRDWYRYGDTIDYMEETYPRVGTSQEDRVQVYEHGLYPVDEGYMDKRDGRGLARELPAMRMWRYYRDSDKAIRDSSARDLGFASHEEALENIVPAVPEEIRDIAEFAGLFTSETVWLQLRPLLYVWWS